MGSGSERTLSNEIEEDEDDLFDFDFRRPIAIIKEEAKVDMGSAQLQPGDHDKVYVAVGKNHWSMDALLWTLNNLTKPSTFVHLIHVFPEVRYIPTPLGNVPKGQVKTKMVEAYVNQVRMYRRGLLQKFLDTCSAFKVSADILLIESDLKAKAVLDLIPVLNIRKLVMGTPRSSLRNLRRGSPVAHGISKNAPDFCEVKLICEGKELVMTR